MTVKTNTGAIAAPAEFAGVIRAVLTAEDWNRLHPNLAFAHSTGRGRRAHGEMRFAYGNFVLAKLCRLLMRLPRPGFPTFTELSITQEGVSEVWLRSFDGLPISSTQRPTSVGLTERFRFVEFGMAARVDDGRLLYESTSMSLRLGPLRARIPKLIAAQVKAVETWERSGTRINVSVLSAKNQLLFSYGGALEWEECK